MADRPDRPLVRTRLHSADLRAEWERHAPAFIAWARKPRHDSYWQFHRDQFLELLPPPGRRTLDVGCGEGRLSRDLKRLGHTMVAVDASPTMVAAARESDPDLDVVLADAADLPFDDASFDLVVAFMSLQDVDDLEGAVSEAARVVEPGGRLGLAVVHPFNSAGRFAREAADSPFVVEGSYLERFRYADELVRDGLEITFVSEHRPIQAYADALASAGLLVERLRETDVPDPAIVRPRSRRWQRIPLFLHVRAVKPRDDLSTTRPSLRHRVPTAADARRHDERRSMAGQMVHLEIPAGDTAKAREFWGGLFGWQFQEFPGSPTEYHTTQFSDTQGGAIYGADGDTRGTRVYFDVEDINAGTARVKELGGDAGDVLPVPGMGWFSVCKDVEGNDFGLWQTDPSASMPGQ
jgi:SAM-dependent methyltransferase/predicted enzyme related to lactoylglutathione lyase